MSSITERSPIRDQPISVLLTVPKGVTVSEAALQDVSTALRQVKQPSDVVLLPEDPGTSAELSARFPQVRLITPEKPGRGAALKAGLSATTHPLIFTMPATGEYQASDLSKMLEGIDQVDVVVGWRKARCVRRRTWEAFWAYLLFGSGLWLKDVTCPVRLYRRSIFPRIPIQSAGPFADVEILAKANFLSCLFIEVEIAWQPPASAPASDGTSYFGDLWRVFERPDFGPANIEGVKA